VHNRNIDCINDAGVNIWTIQETRSQSDNSPYVNIFMKGGYLYAVNYDGWTEKIDLDTGRIIESKYTK
jgi:hypothetical protein